MGYLPQDPSGPSPEDYEVKIAAWSKPLLRHLRYLWEHQGADFFDVTLLAQHVLSEALNWEHDRLADEKAEEADDEDSEDD